ncbi:peptide-methionine (S)-S-oxide reductase [Corticibacter populi]|uniref:Peptide methionine sulfoxide reductase MsrA n=1 Tax=Corticibacter populi TaxID=1550736 RepID=A0A3M6QKC5_9BURK|nr:peptide-methionine (S)-S-oxide reductase MsrA [Corticibacter populi]RMX03483.1 peptide-methionine (S)-S-oxide reductase [Corticibacter populi]RZS29923.1 peptide-methionine (S)-S-oxide reductase [Corticibacter populi]
MTESFITLGAGCFWCTEAVYERVRGVASVECGYANGDNPQRPSYEQVCTGGTGYVEVARIGFDPQVVSLTQLLEIFFTIHDPTSLNRQGADVGTQYRSGIYVENDEEREIAEDLIREIDASGTLGKPVVTEVESLRNYWKAEDYHQNYFANNPHQGYCAAVVGPKVEKFRQTFAALIKP